MAVRELGALRLAVFDLDGTLVDSHHAIVATFLSSLEACGLDRVEEAAITALIGLPLPEMYDRLCPGVGPALRDEAVAAYRRIYPDLDRTLSRTFPAVIEVVRGLRARGIRAAIATSKNRAGLERVCAEQGIASLFDARLSNDDVTRPKPDPAMLLAACARVGVDPAAAAMIGDTSYDVAMGVAAGSRSIGVTWGAHDAHRLRAAGADRVVDDAAELADALR